MSERENIADSEALLRCSTETANYAKAAGGMDAILSTTRQLIHHTGLVRGTSALLKVNQPTGFDCPGCAWPDPAHTGIAEFCENGAKAVADEATKAIIGPEFFKEWSIPQLLEKSDYWLNQQGRLTHPMLKQNDSDYYEPIEWHDAFSLIAKKLNDLNSPDEAVFYTSGRTSNEAAFLYQLFARQFGTNNLPDCSNMCHESSGTGMKESVGVGKGTVSLEDFERADAIFIIGQNPGTNHPRMLSTLQDAARRGCKIVSINPLREVGLESFKHPKELWRRSTSLTDLYLQVRINGDQALLKGIMKEMFEEETRHPGSILDHDFIRTYTAGFEEFSRSIRELSWDVLIEQSGVSREQIRAAAVVAMQSDRLIACWAMGLTQHRNGVENIQEVLNFLMLRGFIGKPGAGACPVRGHSNVQGDRTMGICEKMPEEFLQKLDQVFDFTSPRKHGYDTVASIHAMANGKAKVFVGMGGNFAMASPDTALTIKALQNCQLTVQISTKLNRSHLVVGQEALILPCLGRTEKDKQLSGYQFVSVENSMSVVHSSRGHLAPSSEMLLSEPAIVAGMARATLKEKTKVPWEQFVGNYDLIREAIELVIPGFEGFNQRVRERGGFVLPRLNLSDSSHERTLNTTNGKANFFVHPLPRIELEDNELLMMTIRSHDQYNTTIYGNDDRYRGIYNQRRVILLNPVDIARLGLSVGQLVNISSHFNDEVRHANEFTIVPYDLPIKCAATYFPETNSLVPIDSYARKSRTPTSKSIVIRLHPHKTSDKREE